MQKKRWGELMTAASRSDASSRARFVRPSAVAQQLWSMVAVRLFMAVTEWCVYCCPEPHRAHPRQAALPLSQAGPVMSCTSWQTPCRIDAGPARIATRPFRASSSMIHYQHDLAQGAARCRAVVARGAGGRAGAAAAQPARPDAQAAGSSARRGEGSAAYLRYVFPPDAAASGASSDQTGMMLTSSRCVCSSAHTASPPRRGTSPLQQHAALCLTVPARRRLCQPSWH